MDQSRSLKENMVSLQQKYSLQHSFGEPGRLYKIQTHITISDREWRSLSVATYNDVEITDELDLLKETIRQKRVVETNKAQALWNLFLKEAASVHLEKCTAAERSYEHSAKLPLAANSKTATLSMMAVLVVGFVLAMYYLARPPSPPTVSESEMDESLPLAPLADQTLEKTEPVPLPVVAGHASDDIEPTPPAASVVQANVETGSTGPPVTPAEPSEEVKSNLHSAVVDRLLGPSQSQAEKSQKMRNLTPEEIKVRVQSALKNKRELP